MELHAYCVTLLITSCIAFLIWWNGRTNNTNAEREHQRRMAQIKLQSECNLKEQEQDQYPYGKSRDDD